LPIPVIAADTVIYATGKDQAGRATMNGTIVDYTGELLTIRSESGVEQSIPTPRIVEVKSDWTAAHVTADGLWQQKKYEEAAGSYSQALREERRVWAQRPILVRLVHCFSYLGRFEQAGQAFLMLAESDPQTQHFAAIPLGWTPHQPSPAFEQRAKTWLSDRQNNVAVLIGASWLLPTAEGPAALAALQRLAADGEPRVAMLAQAQAWRTRVVTVTADEIKSWEGLIARMPADLRSGPYFTFGQALSRTGQHEQAALAFLRVPILYPSERPLAAAALLSAGRELEKIGQIQEAVSLYREVVREHAEASVAAEAAGRLTALRVES
jgi:tetratricopeptide (TPR) repeat protein